MKRQDTKAIVRKLTVKKRITLMVILISVFPILVLSIYSYAKAYVSVQSTEKVFSAQVLRTVTGDITTVGARDGVFVPEFLNAENPDAYAVSVLHSRQPDWSLLLNAKAAEYICGALLTAPDGTALADAGESLLFDLYVQGVLSAGEGWHFSENFPLIYYVLPLPSPDNHVSGMLITAFSPNLFLEHMDVFEDDNYNKLTLMDMHGRLLVGCNTLTILEKAAITDLNTLPHSNDPVSSLRSTSSYLCYQYIPAVDATLVLSTPYTQMMKPLQSIFFATLFCTVLLLKFSVIVIDSIDRPMNALVRSFGNAARMNFQVELEDEGLDELGVLSAAYNEICQEMKETLHKVEKEQNDKRKAEIKMLQAQINPHFLFNTLDSLRFTSMMSNIPTVSNGLAALSHLLRSSILKDNSFIPLEGELQNVEDYLTLQKIRSCEIIELNKQIEPEAMQASMMKLLLQPIVENSVIHGIRENLPLHITITAGIVGEMLCISIMDDGRGFDMSKAMETSDSIPKSSRMSGIGLHNVRDRLHLAYRDQQSFSIESQPDCGTVVHITMPYSIWKESPDVSGHTAG